MSLLTDTKRIAAKQHTCDLCCQPIRKGYEYADQRFTDDGVAFTARRHRECIDFMHQIDADEEWWTYGAIVDLADEYSEEDERRRHRIALARPGRNGAN